MFSLPLPDHLIPKPYVSTGDVSVDRLAFFHILERLKTQKRTGWLRHKIRDPESISDHMYRMAVLSLCSSDAELDVSKCVLLSIVHDLAEAQVGDLVPGEGISPAEKKKFEQDAMRNFAHDMLHDSPAALRIEELWKEYEDGETREARFVKDLDRFEMATQAFEYEKREEKNLQTFFKSSIPMIQHPEVQDWARDLIKERQDLRNIDK